MVMVRAVLLLLFFLNFAPYSSGLQCWAGSQNFARFPQKDTVKLIICPPEHSCCVSLSSFNGNTYGCHKTCPPIEINQCGPDPSLRIQDIGFCYCRNATDIKCQPSFPENDPRQALLQSALNTATPKKRPVSPLTGGRPIRVSLRPLTPAPPSPTPLQSVTPNAPLSSHARPDTRLSRPSASFQPLTASPPSSTLRQKSQSSSPLTSSLKRGPTPRVSPKGLKVIRIPQRNGPPKKVLQKIKSSSSGQRVFKNTLKEEVSKHPVPSTTPQRQNKAVQG